MYTLWKINTRRDDKSKRRREGKLKICKLRGKVRPFQKKQAHRQRGEQNVQSVVTEISSQQLAQS